MNAQRPAAEKGLLTRPLDNLNVEDEQLLQSRLSMVPGVRKVDINLFEGTLSVAFNPQRLSKADLENLLEHPDQLLARAAQTSWRRWAQVNKSHITFAAALLLMGGALLIEMLAPQARAILILLYSTIVLLGASFFLRAFANLWSREEVNIDLLISLSVIGALLLDMHFEAALITLMALTAKSLSLGVRQYLMHGTPLHTVLGSRTAWVKESDDFKEVPVASVREGQIVLVKQGGMIPVDGVITTGMAEILEAGITGESAFRVRDQGDTVFAGCIVQYGSFEMRAQHVGADISLSYIEKLVQLSAGKKTARQNRVDAVARICVYGLIPVVLFGALLYAQFMGWEQGQWKGEMFRLALTALIALSPFALIIATPTAFFAGIRKAARRGIVFKSGDVMERIEQITSLLLDKTGTLTYAQPEVARVIAFKGHNERETLEVAALIEQKSNHPLARGIMRHATQQGIVPRPAERFLEFEGGGACAIAEGKHFKIGALWLLQDGRYIPSDVLSRLDTLQREGFSSVLVATREEIIGVIAFEDRVREDAQKTLQALRKFGIRRMVMVTGDNEAVAKRMADSLHLDDVRAGCMPSDKMATLSQEKSRGFIPGMVGDGINDAPALAAAAVGFAMGTAGNDLAIEAADVALLGKDLHTLYETFAISRQTRLTLTFNIVVSLAINIILLFFVLPGIISLAEIVMAQLSVVAVVLLASVLLYLSEVR